MTFAFLPNTIVLFEYYKGLADKAVAQLPDDALFARHGAANSIAIIVQHLAGNMQSRFSDFLTTDGEKPWRNRDAEFETQNPSRAMLLEQWESGWKLLLDTLRSLSEADLSKTVFIRNEGHSVPDAILRQLAHYSYHVGQIVHSTKLLLNDENWNSLTIPKGASGDYNAAKFAQPKTDRHFTQKP